jgi:hypothetical protein
MPAIAAGWPATMGGRHLSSQYVQMLLVLMVNADHATSPMSAEAPPARAGVSSWHSNAIDSGPSTSHQLYGAARGQKKPRPTSSLRVVIGGTCG